MKLIFFGTPAFAATFLSALHADPFFEVVAVVTTPDEPVGRKKILTPPPTKVFALEHDIPLLQPTKLKDPAFAEALRAYGADAFVVVAYGRIIPQAVLDIPPLGCVNIHPSLLPKLRGPSPIVSAIATGERETGVTIMKIDADMDHGPTFGNVTFPIDPRDTADTLTEKVVAHGVPLLLDVLKKYATGALSPHEQNHGAATYCKLLSRNDGHIDWQQSAEAIERTIRAYTPWPGTWTTWIRNGVPLSLKILAADTTVQSTPPGNASVQGDTLLIGTGTSALRITELQPAAGKRMDAASFLRGYADIEGAILG